MATFKCKMCGGSIEIEQGTTVCTCEYCGTQQTLPKLDDERRAGMFDRANHFRRNNEFDKAAGIFEQILNEDSTDAEAYWSIVLCRYGIEYVEDPTTHKRMPTVNRAQYTSIYADEDYKAAIANADALQKTIYESEARAIDEIQKGILEISSKEDPFDVFISFKETGADGKRTRDAVLARELYSELEKEGFKTFFAPVTLETKLGTEYEPYIFAALNSAKVMVVLGTKPEHFNAVWVKNEWSRFLALIKNGAKKTLIPAYRDMDPYDLPEEFSNLLAQDMGKLGFMQDLLSGIKKITAVDEPKTAVKETIIVNNGTSAGNIAPLLKRAFMFLEDGDWERADDFCEQVLNQDPENAQAYLGKLMAEMKVKKVESLKNCAQPFDNSKNYSKVMRFADSALSGQLTGYVSDIRKRLEEARLSTQYGNALNKMKTASKEGDYRVAAGAFRQIANYKDSASLADKCLEKAEECKNNEIYSKAMNLMNRGLESNYSDAISEFQKIIGWKDTDKQISRCREAIAEIKAKEKAAKEEAERKAEEERLAAEKAARRARRFATVICVIAVLLAAGYFGYKKYVVPEQNYKTAVSLMNSESYEEAISAFNALDGYKDSESQINACWTAIYDRDYAAAAALMENGQYEEAISAFNATYGYKDSAAQIEACQTAIKDKEYASAEALMKNGQYEEAIAAFKAMDGYKDSAAQIDACETAIKDQEYDKAVLLKNSGEYEKAYAIFATLSDYKDVDSIVKNDKNIAAAAHLVYLKQFETGGTVTIGSFEQDNNQSNGKEVIEWIVLANDGKKALLISKYALNTMPYNEKRVNITWENCTLRTWLNDDFYDSSFSAEEKDKILKTTVSADKNPEYSTDPGNDTEDHIFLLSIAEVEKYYATDEVRKCVPTDYAIEQGADTSSSNTLGGKATCWWWLRSPGNGQNYAASVSHVGSNYYFGYGVSYDNACVRPALWINLES